MKWIVRGYSFILLAYTGWRTFDFMGSQLPKDDLSFWLSIIFLFATEVGLLIWHELALSYVTTETQESIAKWMTGVDFLGSTASGIADMIIRQTLTNYEIPPWLAQFLIYGLPIIVALNVGAVLLYIWFDGDAWIVREQRQTVFAIKKQAIKDIKRERKTITESKKGLVYQTIRSAIVSEIDRDFGNIQVRREETKAEKQTAINGKTMTVFAQDVPVDPADPTRQRQNGNN